MKGQSATEYLIMLAAALMVALVAIAVLGDFGESERWADEADSAAYWAGAEIGIASFNIPATGNSTLVFRNNRNFPVQLASIAFGNDSFSLGNISLAPGQASEPVSVPATCGKPAGEPFSIPVSIAYADAQYGDARTFIGKKQLIGTCQ